jgi:hypothetical protein
MVKLRAFWRGSEGFCTVQVSSDQPGGAPLPPDLVVVRDHQRDARVQNGNGNQRLLKFSTGVANVGPGPMELWASGGPAKTSAYQRIWNSVGGYNDRLAGSFTFVGHEDHDHWHFENFEEYRLRAVTRDNGVGEIVARSPKVSFCLLDSRIRDVSLTGASPHGYFSCESQGISVGWTDVYGWWLDGQAIDITSVPNGEYWLEVVVDPANQLTESNENNNVGRIRIHVNKTTKTVNVLD